MMKKAKILIDDIGGRFHKGEIGKLLENTSLKYQYCVRLEGSYRTFNIPAPRIFYFHKDEVEVIDEES